MTTSLRRITPTTFTVYDEQENLLGRVYRDALRNWFAQPCRDGQWVRPEGYHKSRAKAVAALEQA